MVVVGGSPLSPLTFSAPDHVYRLHGVTVPSVTQVLRATGYITFDGVPPHRLEAARARGERVHRALQFLLEGDLDDASIDDEVRGYLTSAERYLRLYIRRVVAVERRVFSLRHGYAGTVDLVAVHTDGSLSIDDFKTGQPDDVAADLQTAGYLGAVLEMREQDPEVSVLLAGYSPPIMRRSIRLFGDGRIARESPYVDTFDFARFLTALAVVQDQRRRPRPVVAWDDER